MRGQDRSFESAVSKECRFPSRSLDLSTSMTLFRPQSAHTSGDLVLVPATNSDHTSMNSSVTTVGLSCPEPVERAILDAASNAVVHLRKTCSSKGFELGWSNDFLDGVARDLRGHVQAIVAGLDIYRGPSSGRVSCELRGLYNCGPNPANGQASTGVSNLKSMEWIFEQKVSSLSI